MSKNEYYREAMSFFNKRYQGKSADVVRIANCLMSHSGSISKWSTFVGHTAIAVECGWLDAQLVSPLSGDAERRVERGLKLMEALGLISRSRQKFGRSMVNRIELLWAHRSTPSTQEALPTPPPESGLVPSVVYREVDYLDCIGPLSDHGWDKHRIDRILSYALSKQVSPRRLMEVATESKKMLKNDDICNAIILEL
jgi:hypothetical protein